MKRILSICIAFVLILTTTVTAFSAGITLEEKIRYLADNGFPYDFLESQEESAINDIYHSLYGKQVLFLGTETVSMSESSPEGDVSQLGIIPEDEMTLTISRAVSFTPDTTVGNYKLSAVHIYINYIWESGHPFFTYDDGISVNWDPSLFTYMPNSFIARDYKRTVSNNGDWIETQILNSPTALNQGGLGYYARLAYSEYIMGEVLGALQHKGFASFSLLPAHNPTYLKSEYELADITSINAEYVHTLLFGNLSFSLTLVGYGIAISTNGLTDSVAKTTTNLLHTLKTQIIYHFNSKSAHKAIMNIKNQESKNTLLIFIAQIPIPHVLMLSFDIQYNR